MPTMTDIDYDSPAEEPQEPHALQAQALQSSIEPYPCANVIAQMTHWVLESTRFGYEDVRRWECILRYFRLMNDHQVLFTYYGNIRVTVIAKISEIQEYVMEDSDFVVANRSLFTLLHYVMNDVMSVICRVDPPEMRGDRRRKRTHGGDTSFPHTPLL
jgi:hypothetical protein